MGVSIIESIIEQSCFCCLSFNNDPQYEPSLTRRGHARRSLTENSCVLLPCEAFAKGEFFILTQTEVMT